MDGKVLGVERRRRWSKDEKARIVEETLMPGAVGCEVARRRGVAQSLLFTWRRQARAAEPGGRDGSILLPVEIGAAATPCGPRRQDIARSSKQPTNEVRRHRNRTWLRKPRARRQRSGRRCASTGSERSQRTMIPMPSGMRVWIAAGHTDMRRGMQGLALQVQEQLKRDPHGGDLYIFRGRRGDLAKILWHDGLGLSLYAKRLDRGKFIWPSAKEGVVSISAGQMAYMLEGIDWRNPQLSWRPKSAG
jgi:transposase